MNLQLSLVRKWFDLTQAEIKKEDYREINQYWFKRLVFDYQKVFKYCTGNDWSDESCRDEGIKHIVRSKLSMIGFKPFKVNIMTLGYPKRNDDDRIVRFEHKGIEVRSGNPEWGADPNKLYFVVLHGSRLP